MFFKSNMVWAFMAILPVILGQLTTPPRYADGVGDGRMVTPRDLEALQSLQCPVGAAYGVNLVTSSATGAACICMNLGVPANYACPACPSNSSPVCIDGNPSVPTNGGCACKCTTGYYLNSVGVCVSETRSCPPPNVYVGALIFDICICAPGWSANGTGGCVQNASGALGRRQRRAALRNRLVDQADIEATDEFKCPSGERACKVGTLGGYECLDPLSSLESCGGCASEGNGVNCLEIPGAMGVGCLDGQCKIYSCFPGFIQKGGKCIKV